MKIGQIYIFSIGANILSRLLDPLHREARLQIYSNSAVTWVEHLRDRKKHIRSIFVIALRLLEAHILPNIALNCEVNFC
jgi:hypothetical protein